MATAQDVLKVARGQVGYKESPANSNKTKYGSWYGMNGEPWCAMFVSWVMHQAGISNFSISTSKGFSYTPSGVSWFKSHGLWSASGHYAPGDIIFYDWSGSGHAEHVGLVVSDDGHTIHTIEGNTSSGSNANGGQVQERTRSHGATVLGVGKWKYAASSGAKPPAPPKPNWHNDDGNYGHPTLQKGKNGGAVRHLQGRLLHYGQNIVVDGAFGPDTDKKVRSYQKYYHLHVDGVVGPRTWESLHH